MPKTGGCGRCLCRNVSKAASSSIGREGGSEEAAAGRAATSPSDRRAIMPPCAPVGPVLPGLPSNSTARARRALDGNGTRDDLLEHGGEPGFGMETIEPCRVDQ